jgi:hypothetical protein
MKRLLRIIIIFSFLFKAESVFAQPDRDKVEALRTAFISKKLELTASEAEKFWPVYNEYNDKVKAIRKNLRQSYRKKSEPLTEKEAEELYYLDLQSKQMETDIHKQYSEKIKAIIGVKKIVKLRLAEEEFKREMINSIKDKSD